MGITDIIRQYASGAAGAATPSDSAAHFDEVASGASPSDLGRGISRAMRSDQTPAFGDMVGQLLCRHADLPRHDVLPLDHPTGSKSREATVQLELRF